MADSNKQSGACLLTIFAATVCVVLGGCGGAVISANPTLSIEAGAHTLATGSQLRLTAVDPRTNEPAPARWTITSSDNAPALGPGAIDATGVYTAPGALSRDEVSVTLAAAMGAETATTQLTLTPGFAQPLSPENATVAPGQSIEVTARLAEVNAGSVTWSLDPAVGTGALSATTCTRASRAFTSCNVTYTAPPRSTPVPGPASARIVATANAGGSGAGGATTALHVLLNGIVSSNPVSHQLQQMGAILLGSSGGNDNDFDTYSDETAAAGRPGGSYIADCCGGTLGALVEDQAGQRYILSNNHVLAESDQAHAGDAIVQPGTIDDACVPLSEPGAKVRPVAALRASVPLDVHETNVDAALAGVAPGAVDSSGSILELGSAQNGTLAAAPPVGGRGEWLTAANLAGIEVAKSGRTTGLTCSTINSVELAVKVDYYRDCAETQPYTTKVFSGQIGIPGNSFSDAGDSGALVVDAANAQPVGLFYAGSTANALGPGLSIANPIGDVLAELGGRVGSSLSVVGTGVPHPVACLNYDAMPPLPTRDPLSLLTPSERSRAREAARTAQALVSRDSGILGATAGASADHPGEAAVILYLDRARAPGVPKTVAGVRTAVILTDAASLAGGMAPSGLMPVEGIHLTAKALADAAASARRLSTELLADPAIFGVGVTQSLATPQEAALLVLVDSSRPAPEMLTALDDSRAGGLPAMLRGLRVRYLEMHRFRVTRARESSTMTSCRLRAQTAAKVWSAADAERQVYRPLVIP